MMWKELNKIFQVVSYHKLKLLQFMEAIAVIQTIWTFFITLFVLFGSWIFF